MGVIMGKVNKIILAGGCFWGVEHYFAQIKGIELTRCVYVDGKTASPTYEQLKKGLVTHAEGVYLEYNESISLEKLLELYLRIVEPFNVNKQGHDEGLQYRTGIYSFDQSGTQILTINKYLKSIFAERYDDVKIDVKIIEENTYFTAEDYHQKYLVKNPNGYCHVNFSVLNKEDIKEDSTFISEK
jgi:methionine-S-sulfoxide reductase